MTLTRIEPRVIRFTSGDDSKVQTTKEQKYFGLTEDLTYNKKFEE